ncbi:YcgN family cysteine cluster protein [Parahaliea mediterranea]|uniref:YcgN family cysteine cluster protein n=1 Tax=Parahaliea mediterranea TaxID=651086 RepID=UPI000E2FC066|nr:YcgN family cysteine cluster protein [Parahaliea mediterranea]
MAEWWDTLPLAALDHQQWEALCDGCAKCCLHKLQDADSGELFYTNVHCHLLDAERCRCSDYPRRSERVPDCIQLTAHSSDAFDWLPTTCAYRLRAHGQPLPAWHPLVSGNPDIVHSAGISIRGRSISDEYVHPDGYDEHIVNWVE